jgi:hypothetical protein
LNGNLLSSGRLELARLLLARTGLDFQTQNRLSELLHQGSALDLQNRLRLLDLVALSGRLNVLEKLHLGSLLIGGDSLNALVRGKLAQTVGLDAAALPGIAGAQLQLRGILHEAIAAPPMQGMTQPLPIAPPAPLVENVSDLLGPGREWIGGYWSWNPVNQGYQWVSGVIRLAPPGRHWMPGQWVKGDDGFVRVPGAWIPNGVDHLQLLAAPPVSPTEAIPAAANALTQFWNPGHFEPQDNGGYEWVSGFWSDVTPENQNWVWHGPQLLHTPTGALFVPGYWDHPLTECGIVFAPLQLAPKSLVAGLAANSTVVIDLQRAAMHLFVDPASHQYMFGNLYGAVGAKAGLISWAHAFQNGQYFDPLFSYYQRTYAQAGIDLAARLISWNDYFQNHPDLCPPVSLGQLSNFLSANSNNPIAAAAVLAGGINTSLVALAGLSGPETPLAGVAPVTVTSLYSPTLVSLGGALGGSNGTAVGLADGRNGLVGGVGTIGGLGAIGGIGTPVGGIGGLFGTGGALGGSIGGLGGSIGGLGGIGGLGIGGGLIGGGGGGLIPR